MAKIILKHPIPIPDERSGVVLQWHNIECESWVNAAIIDGVEIVYRDKRYTIPVTNIVAIIE